MAGNVKNFSENNMRKIINILIVETTRKNNLIAIVKTTIITKIQNKHLPTKIQETIL